ncbi:MAG TPA: hypothetical protein VEX68_10880 [Bryobacteraceae bacterium]|nr:hypothetical protein [Bryobacteraceae bacterium]
MIRPFGETRELVSLTECGRAVGKQLFAAAKHDRHSEDAHSVDEVVGEQRVDEFGTALGGEIRAVFLSQALHVGDIAQEH